MHGSNRSPDIQIGLSLFLHSRYVRVHFQVKYPKQLTCLSFPILAIQINSTALLPVLSSLNYREIGLMQF